MISISTLINLLISINIPTEDIKPMVCIAYEESKFNSKAINKDFNRNGTIDYGLFQINSIWLKKCKMTGEQLLDVHNNIKCTKIVYNTQGITAWSTHKRCI